MNLDEIKRSEGFRSKAYRRNGDVWTIGYGSTYYKDNSRIKEGDTITEPDASALLQYKIEKEYLPQLQTVLDVSKFNDNQISALISLLYNIGIGNLKKSRLLSLLQKNAGELAIRYEWYAANIMSGTQFEKGLRARRMREANLFFTL